MKENYCYMVKYDLFMHLHLYRPHLLPPTEGGLRFYYNNDNLLNIHGSLRCRNLGNLVQETASDSSPRTAAGSEARVQQEARGASGRR